MNPAKTLNGHKQKENMNIQKNPIMLMVLILMGGNLIAAELPRLSGGVDPKTAPDLKEPYASTSPEDLGDGLQVGTLDLPGTKEAVKALIADDKAGEYDNLDSILIWKDGKLLFEYYNRRGRVDAPHYTMSVTKTLSSCVLARAIQRGLLGVEDLDKPVISFMPEIDRSKIKPGVETITLREVLYMESGLRFKNKNITRTLAAKYSHQEYFQKIFEETEPVTPESKEYKYTGLDPSIILMIIDIRASGTVQEFIKEELADKFQAIYTWNDQSCGIPSGGAGAHFTSRSLLKIGMAVIQGGKFNGEQLLSPEYVKLIMEVEKKEKHVYHYYFHKVYKNIGSKRVYMISGNGAGGQYMATFPELNIVVAATSHNKRNIGAPLLALADHLLPLFVK